jgi:LmbE family N-acetylglucosaminyl deacetylase
MKEGGVPSLTFRSRLLIFAPHPDDESLACGILLQHAVNAEAAVLVIYLTDGENNPWPQRQTEVKRRAIRCHQSQLILSRRRFLSYATRPELLGGGEAVTSDM